MRLLNARSKTLESFDDEALIPRYAILSHTWGATEQEVSFIDLASQSRIQFLQNVSESQKSTGWSKIEGVCIEALNWEPVCEYVWVDTCCIDKSSSAELQEAINSMFRWYECAEVCFAYLSDVTWTTDQDQLISTCYTEFRAARWFTRGWTLQELLAPDVIVFFDRDWIVIGQKRHLDDIISEITGIDHKYIWQNKLGSQKRSMSWGRRKAQILSSASVAERMSWASLRHTKRPEDIAYCLLGIFDIHMPMLYGEGHRAFTRLQEEIMKVTDDCSIIAWGYEQPDYDSSSGGLLASHPRLFQNCRGLVNDRTEDIDRPSFEMTQRGLRLSAIVKEDPNHQYILYVALPCILPENPTNTQLSAHHTRSLSLALPLVSVEANRGIRGLMRGTHSTEDTEFTRPEWCFPVAVPEDFLKSRRSTWRTITIRRPHIATETFIKWPFALTSPSSAQQGFHLLGMYPPQPWNGNFVHLSSFIEPFELAKALGEPSTAGPAPLSITLPQKSTARLIQIEYDRGRVLIVLSLGIGDETGTFGGPNLQRIFDCRVLEFEHSFDLVYLIDLVKQNRLHELTELDRIVEGGEHIFTKKGDEKPSLNIVVEEPRRPWFATEITILAINSLVSE